MSRTHIPVELRRLVIERALGCCEYCLPQQDDTPFTHQLDHLIAVKHYGQTSSENLALACLKCNRNKGSDLSALDPLDGSIVTLFNPRTQRWAEHFVLDGARVVGLTPTGRATVQLLRINDRVRLAQRRRLAVVGRYPPAQLGL
jgi:hypothetical protein